MNMTKSSITNKMILNREGEDIAVAAGFSNQEVMQLWEEYFQ